MRKKRLYKGGKGKKHRNNFVETGKKYTDRWVQSKEEQRSIDNAYIVCFTPEDLKIVKEEPEKRRKFMDRELCQLKPVYYSTLARYKKVLMQRNSLLKSESLNNELMEIWENNLADYGSRIIIERMNFVEKLKIISKQLHSSITDGKEELDLFYESSVPVKGSREEIKEAFIKKLNKERKRDIFRGSTGSGPHRDDLRITIDGKDVRNYGSQGQQRTAALSLKLAEVRIIQEEKRESGTSSR